MVGKVRYLSARSQCFSHWVWQRLGKKGVLKVGFGSQHDFHRERG